MPQTVRDTANSVWKYACTFLRWTAIAAVIGAVGGAVGAAFDHSVSIATAFREEHTWLIWLLPVGGLGIAALYRQAEMEKVNTNTVIDAIRQGENVPPLLVPLIFAATSVTHLLGGSAGREGAALQIGGGIGAMVGRVFRLDEKDGRLTVMCGMSALFSALFGTPLTAAVFALEVVSVGTLYYSALLPCLVSALTAGFLAGLLGVEPFRLAAATLPLSAGLLWRVALLGILCALMSIAFCVVIHGSERLIDRALPNIYLRSALGGAALIALTYLVGVGDYNGAGIAVIRAAVEQGTARPGAFAWKLLFTAVTLGCGFKGGEVVPIFFVGAAFGCTVGPLLGLPAGFAAAVGLVSVFCGVVNCPLASILLAVELFGSAEAVVFAVPCAVSYMLSGYFGLYSSQKTMYSKTRLEYVNIQAK